MKAVALALVLALALNTSQVLACVQSGGTQQIRNTDIKVRFTYDDKPIANARIDLESVPPAKLNARGFREANKTELLMTGKTNRNGWVVFKNLQPGEYRVLLQEPSHESVRIMLRNPGQSRSGLNHVQVNYVGDWCFNLAVLEDWLIDPAKLKP